MKYFLIFKDQELGDWMLHGVSDSSDCYPKVRANFDGEGTSWKIIEGRYFKIMNNERPESDNDYFYRY